MEQLKLPVEFEVYYIRFNLLRRILIAKEESIKIQFFMSQIMKSIISFWQLKKSFQPALNYFNPILKEPYNMMLLLPYLLFNYVAIDKVITPQKGKLVVFQNCYKGTDKPHPDSLHGALPVIKGEKWAFNLWFRKNPRKQ